MLRRHAFDFAAAADATPTCAMLDAMILLCFCRVALDAAARHDLPSRLLRYAIFFAMPCLFC